MHDASTPPARLLITRLAACGLVVGALLATPSLWAQPVTCHLAYAGATRSFTVAPSRHTDDVPPLVEGSSFAFEVVNRLPPEPGAGVQVRTYAVFADQPFLIHQASYTHTAAQGLHGFTGLQVVREPLRSNEVSYWCERPPGR